MTQYRVSLLVLAFLLTVGISYAAGTTKPKEPACDVKAEQALIQQEENGKEYSKDAPWYEHRIQALTHFSMGRLPQAESETLEALKIAQSINDKEPQQELLRLLGTIYLEEKKNDLAIPTLEEALVMERQNTKPGKIALMNTLLNLGQAYESQQQHAKAIPVLQEAKSMTTPCNPMYYGIVVSLGKAYLGANKLTEAEPVLKETLKIAQDHKKEDHVLDNLCELAVLYIRQKQYAKALQMVEAAEPLNKKLTPPNSQASIMFNKNLQHLREAVNVKPIPTGNAKHWMDLMQSGKKNLAAKKFALAATDYEKALKLADAENPQSPPAALNRVLLASTYADLGRLKESELLLGKALPVLRKNPETIPPQALANYEKMYQALKAKNHSPAQKPTVKSSAAKKGA